MGTRYSYAQLLEMKKDDIRYDGIQVDWKRARRLYKKIVEDKKERLT